MERHQIRSYVLPLLVVLAAVGTSRGATLYPIYTVTDLGSSYRFIKDASGDTSLVASGDGAQAYPFLKHPTNYQIQLQPWQVTSLQGTQNSSFYYIFGGAFGFTHSVSAQFGAVNEANAPFGLYWENHDLAPISPIRDANSADQIVGSNLGSAVVSDAYFPLPINPAFPSAFPGTLDHMILGTANLHLTAGLFIDEEGRIIAEGYAPGDATPQDFLLTPTPTPEPSTLTTLGMVLAGLGVRAWRRKVALQR